MKHRKIFDLIFKIPVSSQVCWKDVEALLRHLGAEISAAKGSRVLIVFNGVKIVLHRPHPRKEIDKGALVSVRKFLLNAGVHYDEI